MVEKAPLPDPLPAGERGKTVWWLVIAGGVWLSAMGFSRWRGEPTKPTALPAWQQRVSELTAAQQDFHGRVRAAIETVEKQRASGAWPSDFLPGFAMQHARLTTNYVGEAEGLRWLVLFLEPDPRSPPENAPPDDEHHRLADGTPLHVTVWTQPLSTPASTELIGFPAAEGWVERVRR
jgi:hypothetical protein